MPIPDDALVNLNSRIPRDPYRRTKVAALEADVPLRDWIYDALQRKLTAEIGQPVDDAAPQNDGNAL